MFLILSCYNFVFILKDILMIKLFFWGRYVSFHNEKGNALRIITPPFFFLQLIMLVNDLQDKLQYDFFYDSELGSTLTLGMLKEVPLKTYSWKIL